MKNTLPSKHLVLYADDDQEDIEFVREEFSKYSRDIELINFPDGSSLLRFLNNLSSLDTLPCLIIIDIQMPGLNGKEVLSKLRQIKRYENIPVVLFTNSSLPSERAFARSFDADYIVKPFYRNQINELIDHILHHCSEDFKNLFHSK